MSDLSPSEICYKITHAQTDLMRVSQALSVWSGHKAWADFPSAGQQEAGRHGLAKLDAVIADLAAARAELAAAVEATTEPADTPGADMTSSRRRIGQASRT